MYTNYLKLRLISLTNIQTLSLKYHDIESLHIYKVLATPRVRNIFLKTVWGVREAFLFFMDSINPPARFEGVENHNFLNGRAIFEQYLSQRMVLCTAE